MERFKRLVRKLLCPHPLVTALLALTAGAGLGSVFANGLERQPIAFAVYPLSFYALCVVLAALPGRITSLRSKKAPLSPEQRARRTRFSLYRGTVFNLIYAAFKLLMGVYCRSVWFGAVAVYYMVLCLTRFLVVQSDRTAGSMEDEARRLQRRWSGYRTCGWLLLAVNAAMTGMVFQMIWQDRAYSYPGFLIYAMAAYTFYRLTKAIVGMVKLRRADNPAFSAARALDLCVALMSVFALQTAMFTAFGAGMEAGTRQLMNHLTGGGVCLAVVCVALHMILRGRRALRALRMNNTQT